MIKHKSPYFSIITIALNTLNGLQRTHESLCLQHYIDFEWIIIDGGSTDGTPEWMENMNAPCTHVTKISEPDDGLYHAMNKGLNHARGQYVLFLNAGDTLCDGDVLSVLGRAITAQNHPDFIYGDAYEEMEDRTLFYKPAKPLSRIKRGMITHHQAMVYKRETIDDMQYDTRYKLAADYDFTLRFLEHAKHSVHCATPICVFEHGGLSQTGAAQARAEEFQIRKNLNICSALSNHLNRRTQSIKMAIRQNAPWIYRLMRG